MVVRRILFFFIVFQVYMIAANIPLTIVNDNIVQDNQIDDAHETIMVFVKLYECVRTNDFVELQGLIEQGECIDAINMFIMTIAVLLNQNEMVDWLTALNDQGIVSIWPFMSEANLLINLDLFNLDLINSPFMEIRQAIFVLYANFFTELTEESLHNFIQTKSVHLSLEEDDNHFLQLLLDYDRLDLVCAYINARYIEPREVWDADDQYVLTILLGYYKDTVKYKDACYDAIHYLLSLGFDPNAQNECPTYIGRYITWAAQNNLIAIVDLLLAYGAPIHQVEDSYDHDNCSEIEEILGLTSIEIARKYKYDQLLELLSC